MPTPDEIVKHHALPPDHNPWVGEPPPPAPILIVPYDGRWPVQYELVASRVRGALGGAALALQHIGSTSVPGLPAKPILDIDLAVADPADEAAYVPALEHDGFKLVIREPAWHEHRLLTLAEPRTHLHVFGPDCAEPIRHRLFRDWLREHAQERALYLQAKLEAVGMLESGSGSGMEYNQRKERVLHEIYERVFRAHGLLPAR